MTSFLIRTIPNSKLLVAFAILSICFVSCQKDKQTEALNRMEATHSFYQPKKMDNYDAYLKEFKTKMLETRNDESMDLAEAAWHLSSVANHDFGHANVIYSDILYDTLYGSVTITNGQVKLSDLGRAYTDIANTIESYYQSFNQENKHFRFIDAFISENGTVTLPLIITYTAWDHVWFFPDRRH